MEKEVSVGVRSNQSSEKMLKILEFLARQREPIRLMDISKFLGINSSTVLRFLTSLVDNGYAAQDKETSRYYLTYKICALSNQVLENVDIRRIARPYMKEISAMFGETVCLAVEKDMKVVYMEVVESPNSTIRSMQRIGNIAPMHCTGIGKLLLFNYTEEDIDRLILKEGMPKFTEYTPTTKWELMELLKTAKKEGLAYDNEECEIGARCVAVPVYDSSGRVMAGISVTGPKTRLTDELIAPRLGELKRIVGKVSREMGYQAFGE
ncbi:MAG: IclR family transcriptional regulator [Hungatella sp.]|jgi:DNA-binding IclR family transcriptional regulator|nr:IclR family transcriptional regulator [Hungatella sp.]